MEEYKYLIKLVEPDSVTEIDTISIADDNLISEFDINSSFNPLKDYIELHYYTLDGRLLTSVEHYTNILSNQDSETANGGTLNTLQLNVENDVVKAGYIQGDVNVLYNFLSDPFTNNTSKEKFYIEEISGDRTELRLLSLNLSDEVLLNFSSQLKVSLQDPSIGNLKLNFGENILLLAVNADTLPYKEGTSLVVKLYNPLPENLGVKDTLSLAFEVSDPAAYNITAELIQTPTAVKYLKGPNTSLEGDVNTSFPTEYLNIQEAYAYQVTSSYYQVKSLFEEKGAELSIDHSDYTNFINFSSAEERLKNFKYKADLISSYQVALNSKTLYTGSVQSYSGSQEYYSNLINNILSNFDHYDRFLYYESSSFAWPKTTSTKPYALATGSITGSWYNNQLSSASLFDSINPNLLLNTVPTFIKDDPANEQYNVFVHMVAQHFDNIWIYAKGLSEKYNADNRLDYGISKDLIQDALRNFGVKLYTSNKSTQELFKMFTGDSYTSGSESYVSTIISGSNETISEEDYRKQIYKRLYHNLPLLLKTKGTERGVRALLNSFGVPSLYSETTGSVLNLTQFGGTLISGSNSLALPSVSSSLDKIRLDNTGSIVGNTLSRYTSIIKRDQKYSPDSHLLEVGFSPTTYINELILASGSLQNFNIDQIIGDPGYAFSSSYEGLAVRAEQALSGSITDRYNLKDFTRLIKFYDNVLFKTVKDFLPGRNDVSTGIIIKPHILERSKAPQVRNTTERHNDLSGSIYIANITGSSGDSFGSLPQNRVEEYAWSGSNIYGGVFDSSSNQYLVSYTESIQTPDGLATSDYHNFETTRYDGEFSGSHLRLSSGELNDENTYKYDSSVTLTFGYNFIDGDLDCNIVWGEWDTAPGTTPAPTTPEPSTPSPTPEPTTPSPTTAPTATTPEPSTPEPSTPTPTPEPTATTPEPTPEPTTPAPTTPEPTTPEPTTPTPTPEPTTPAPTTPEPTTPEPTTPTPVEPTTWYRFSNCSTSLLVWQVLASEPVENSRWYDGSDYFVYTNLSTTILPSPVVTNLLYLNGEVDCPVEPTPSPVTQTAQVAAINCSTLTTAYFNVLNESTIPQGFSISVGGQCYEITNDNYTGPEPLVNVSNEFLSPNNQGCLAAECNSTTPEPSTPAPTPEPTTPAPIEVYAFLVAYDANSETIACGESAETTIYSTDAVIVTESILYTDGALTTRVANGYWADKTIDKYYYVEGAGTVNQVGDCPVTTPAPTPAPTSNCTSVTMQAVGSSTSTAACGVTPDTVRGHNGSLSDPGIGDTIFARDTCAATFNGGGLWYSVLGDNSAIQVNSSGIVTNKMICTQ